MQLICPRCGSKTNELMECDDCGAIGCMRCMRKKYGKWVCFRCQEPEKKYYYQASTYESESKKEDEVADAFSAMFG